jgi:hypothetical protein
LQRPPGRRRGEARAAAVLRSCCIPSDRTPVRPIDSRIHAISWCHHDSALRLLCSRAADDPHPSSARPVASRSSRWHNSGPPPSRSAGPSRTGHVLSSNDPKRISAGPELLSDGPTSMSDGPKLMSNGRKLMSDRPKLMSSGQKLMSDGQKLLSNKQKLMSNGQKLLLPQSTSAADPGLRGGHPAMGRRSASGADYRKLHAHPRPSTLARLVRPHLPCPPFPPCRRIGSAPRARPAISGRPMTTPGRGAGS